MSEELESCPLCGALPADQVDSDAVEERVRNRYTFSRQGLLDDCASREAARRIVDWADNGKLADDEWLVERNETAIIAICRALLSSPRVERARALEEAAAIARAHRDKSPEYGTTLRIWSRACAQIEDAIRARIRSLSPQGE